MHGRLPIVDLDSSRVASPTGLWGAQWTNDNSDEGTDVDGVYTIVLGIDVTQKISTLARRRVLRLLTVLSDSSVTAVCCRGLLFPIVGTDGTYVCSSLRDVTFHRLVNSIFIAIASSCPALQKRDH